MRIKIPEETLNRYHALVDQSFHHPLAPEEEAEMERLGQEIDAATAPYYRPIIERLEREIERRR